MWAELLKLQSDLLKKMADIFHDERICTHLSSKYNGNILYFFAQLDRGNMCKLVDYTEKTYGINLKIDDIRTAIIKQSSISILILEDLNLDQKKWIFSKYNLVKYISQLSAKDAEKIIKWKIEH